MAEICVVGAGRWGQNHVRTLDELGYLAALVDQDEDRLVHFRSLYPHLETYTELDPALDAGYDAFTVATPAQTHYQVACAILASGCPVLVEKPLALSAGDARKMAGLARENGQQLMVGHLMLFHPAIVKMKALMADGVIGQLCQIYSNRVNLGTVRTEENVLWSFSPHDISIFQYLTESKPIDVACRGGAFLQPGVHDTTVMVLTYPDGVICHNFVSWLHPFKEHRIVVIGTEGMLTFEDSAEGKPLRLYEKRIDFVGGEPIRHDGPVRELEYSMKAPLAEELRYFAENARGKILKADATNGIEVLEILEQATAQLDGQAGSA